MVCILLCPFYKWGNPGLNKKSTCLNLYSQEGPELGLVPTRSTTYLVNHWVSNPLMNCDKKRGWHDPCPLRTGCHILWHRPEGWGAHRMDLCGWGRHVKEYKSDWAWRAGRRGGGTGEGWCCPSSLVPIPQEGPGLVGSRWSPQSHEEYSGMGWQGCRAPGNACCSHTAPSYWSLPYLWLLQNKNLFSET